MKREVSRLMVARRLIPWFLVNFILLPLTGLLILIGFGQETSDEFWEAVT